MTQLTIDPQLLQEALALSKEQTTADELISAMLHEYIQRQKQRQIFDLFGTIDYDPSYDYKQQRQTA
ncbi:MAG: type II toxin-antitoxin system VapB family antitoxin [Cyanobacteria bacterium P01_G01_bin.54]